MRITCFFCLAVVGCAVEADVASLTIVSPAPGSTYMRDQLGAQGALVANVPIEIEAGGEVARVAIKHGDLVLGDLANDKLTAQVAASGAVKLSAVALDAAGGELVTATIDIAVAEPTLGCHGWLDLYKLDYTLGPAKQGVADPVTVAVPINGISYRYNGSAAPRDTLYGDCSLIKSLAQGAAIMRAHGVTELIDIGVYNYRCIDQTKTPPNCTMSQHAYAKAIDIAGFEDSNGARYSVLTDWVIDTQETCAAPTEPGKDEFLHKVICELKAADVWNIVLTPNYNDAHRNHFHVDLTNGSDFIERTGPVEPEHLVIPRAFVAD